MVFSLFSKMGFKNRNRHALKVCPLQGIRMNIGARNQNPNERSIHINGNFIFILASKSNPNNPKIDVPFGEYDICLGGKNWLKGIA